MSYYFITFRSVTHAQRGEKVLQKEGLRCTLQRTPRWMEEKGCGYSLRLYAGSVHRAVELLKDQRIPLRRVYAQTASGDLEELEL